MRSKKSHDLGSIFAKVSAVKLEVYVTRSIFISQVRLKFPHYISECIAKILRFFVENFTQKDRHELFLTNFSK